MARWPKGAAVGTFDYVFFIALQVHACPSQRAKGPLSFPEHGGAIIMAADGIVRELYFSFAVG